MQFKKSTNRLVIKQVNTVQMQPRGLATQQGVTKKLFVLFLLSILVAGAGAGYLGHWLGFKLGAESFGETAKAYHKLRSEADGREKLIAELKQKSTVAMQERDISLKNMEDIRDNLAVMQRREEFLIAQRDAYQSMVANQGGVSLKVYDQKIKPLPENAFEYRFDLVLVQAKDRPARHINVDLTLLDGDAIVRVPLRQSRYEIDGFKRVQGRFIMPKGFTPKKLKLVVQGVGEENVVQYYRWGYGKKIQNMPAGLADVPKLEDIDIS